MIKRFAIILLLTGCITALYGQDDAVINSAVLNITKQLLIFPQEKIYLHMDKSYYITGEKIFFRVFLLDAFSNQQDTLSRYVYVELINPADSVMQRVKIRRDSTDMFYGAIPLREDLPQGSYMIRAYTQYMRNQGESSLFTKQVQISDPQILSIQTETDFQFIESEKVNVSLRFIDTKTKDAIKLQEITLRLNQDRAFTSKPDKDGWVRVKLTVPDKAPTRVLFAELVNDRNVFKQYIPIPYPEGDFDVSFYPEGGNLIAGQSSNVAFKAIDSHGAALDIKGEVINSQGDTVTDFKTVHDGMGDFLLTPQPGERYKAVIQVKGEGEEAKGTRLRVKEINLSEVQINAFSLKATYRDDKLLVTINHNAFESFPELYLLIHSRGSIIYAKAWNPSKAFVTFDKSIFPSGISHILLLTKDLQIVSERLVFMLNDDNGFVTFQTQKDVYKKREQVKTEIRLKDGNRQPLKGNFSISITNDKEVVPDTTLSILSDILLRSELRGNIENPEYYFQKRNKDVEQAADLLMKTHGWTRYAIPDVVRGKLTYPQIPFEQSQEIAGTVKSGLLSKRAPNFKVTLVSEDGKFFDTTETDKAGRYTFRNFEFPDSTKYFIQALNKKEEGKYMTELYIDSVAYPNIQTSRSIPCFREEKSNPVFRDYVAKADLYYTYENGKRIINLPEIEVNAVYKKKYEYKSYLYSEPDNSISTEEIERFGGTSVTNLLYTVPGLFVSGDKIKLLSAASFGDTSPLLLIDDVVRGLATGGTLNTINIKSIGQIDVIKSAGRLAFFGARGANGVISIHTKKGKSHTASPALNIKSTIPLGYQLPVEFYSPKYETQESIDNPKPDFRTTIFWKPNVMTEYDGIAKPVFYTADDPGTYSVIIEGVSAGGKLIHYQGKGVITVE